VWKQPLGIYLLLFPAITALLYQCEQREDGIDSYTS
jgi:hypothetical protein